MIAVLSPAKTLDFSNGIKGTYAEPQFADESEYLVGKLKKLSPRQIKTLMSVSNDLAEVNHQRFQEWSRPFDLKNAKPAIHAFRGDVYRGLNAETLKAGDLEFAEKHVRILSGLYGILKPLDLIQPYRLEMGTRFKVTPAKKNLYAYWDNKITDAINEDLGDGVLLNLASHEYFKSIKARNLKGQIVNVQFLDEKGGDYKSVQFWAKQARGLMTRYIIDNRVDTVEGIKTFDIRGYKYNDRLSDENSIVFSRDAVDVPPAPL